MNVFRQKVSANVETLVRCNWRSLDNSHTFGSFISGIFHASSSLQLAVVEYAIWS